MLKVYLSGEFVEKTRLAEHRPNAAHLDHQPLGDPVFVRFGPPRKHAANPAIHDRSVRCLTARDRSAVVCRGTAGGKTRDSRALTDV